jgi:hypothetical protein
MPMVAASLPNALAKCLRLLSFRVIGGPYTAVPPH